MKKTIISTIIILITSAICAMGQSADSLQYKSPTEGVIGQKFTSEKALKLDLLNMIAEFSQYASKIYTNEKRTNSRKDSMGGFRSKEPLTATEDGIRTNADMGMICAYLWKYGQAANISLPEGVTYQRLYNMAMRSLTFTYSTHRANNLHRCRDNRNWGSVPGVYQYESSLWAMSMAYQAYFLWDSISASNKKYIQRALDAECDYILQMPVKCKMRLDTRAEENGWDACVLAANLGLFPDSPKAGKYFNQLRLAAINTLSHISDEKNQSIIDPSIDSITVKQLYRGANLFEDYTLQNHDYFHPGYQNVAIQELGEAALALRMFQQNLHGRIKHQTNALMHNCQTVTDEVLNYLAIPDGELAMPNGNDWSQYLFDQITTYSTMACILRDPDALMLENLAYQNIKARQTTTGDGTWLQNSDIGPRRMGVQAHRVMMTHLMHETYPTQNMKPSKWDEFLKRHYTAKAFKTQNVVRAASPDRYAIFSASSKRNISGFFVPNNPGYCKTAIPISTQYGTGNFLGHYIVKDAATIGKNSIAPRITTDSNSFVLNCEYSTNSYYLTRRHALYCTPGNAIISLDMTRNNNGNHTITEEKCGQLTISMDPFTNIRRTLYHEGGCDTVDGKKSWKRESGWLNIDNMIGVINCSPVKTMTLGSLKLSSSIYVRELFASYSGRTRIIPSNEMIGRNSMVYLSNISACETRKLARSTICLDTFLTEGWMGVITEDRRGKYLLISNFFGLKNSGSLSNMPMPENYYFPVITGASMRISGGRISAEFNLAQNESIGMRAGFMIKGNNISIKTISPTLIIVEALEDTQVSITYSNPATGKNAKAATLNMRKYTALPVEWKKGKILH